MFARHRAVAYVALKNLLMTDAKKNRTAVAGCPIRQIAFVLAMSTATTAVTTTTPAAAVTATAATVIAASPAAGGMRR
jgi:hypothetical protein